MEPKVQWTDYFGTLCSYEQAHTAESGDSRA